MTAHKTCSSPEILPLLARVDPIPGESLMSLVARACEANVFPRVSDLLAYAGVTGLACFAPFTADEQAGGLARLLGVPEAEIRARMHEKLDPKGAMVSWAGVRMERRFIEARTRRISPTALRQSPHHQLEWTNRALSFCPQTLEPLISACPRCARQLGWTRTLGLTRCEHCKASLLDLEPDGSAPVVSPSAQAAARLISSDLAARKAALAVLPEPFGAWDAGEAFCAVVELGVAWSRPEAVKGSPTMRALGFGTLEVTAEEIAAGYDGVVGWSQFYPALLDRIVGHRPRGASLSLLELGTLGRLFQSKAPPTRLRAVLQQEIAQAAHTAKVPLRLGGLTHLGVARSDRGRSSRAQLTRPGAGTLGLSEASAKFRISNRTLRRLAPKGQSLWSANVGRGGSMRFDEQRLGAAVAAYKRGVDAVTAGVALGVPAYCMGAFADIGLLDRITDSDAALLAGVDQLFERASLELLLADLKQLDHGYSFWGEPLWLTLERQFAPEVWATVFDAILSGDLEILALDDQAKTPADYIQVDGDKIAAFIAGLPASTVPAQATVSARSAGRLLGISGVYVGELISAGALEARSEGGTLKIDVGALAEFSERCILSPEFYRRTFAPRGTSGSYFSMVEPVLVTRHVKAWLRSDVEVSLT